ncbi:MAG TPA: hypothetical protein VLX91_03850 [Candidatus Acidoferrales bacterium]|nr:hypothetical protein [Candidatus Acidoferrales bacterium]
MKKINFNHFNLLFVSIFIAGCGFQAAVFDQAAYEHSVSLKVDALNLMGKATSPYDSCRTEIEAVIVEFQKAYEYAKGLPNNDETVKQYEIMMDPQQASFFGFLARWESEGRLGATFVGDARAEVSRHFDDVIGLESGKKKKT